MPISPALPLFESPVSRPDMDRTLRSMLPGGTTKSARRGRWILRNRDDREIETSFTEGSGRDVSTTQAHVGAVVYARSIVELDTRDESTLTLKANVTLECADTCTLVAMAFADEALTTRLSRHAIPLQNERTALLNATLPALAGLHLVIQIDFPNLPFSATDFRLDLSMRDPSTVQPLRSFDIMAFGGYEKASARLRAWKLAKELQEVGHTVSIDEGTRASKPADVRLFQKVRPFKLLAAMDNADEQILAFDFDDNYFLPERGDRSEFIAFINQMDVLLVGSEHLREVATEYHPNVVLVDNPVDIDDPGVVRTQRPWSGRIGWFGAPENRGQLAAIDYEGAVVTVTRGGDIEYEHDLIDQTLVEFDLLLFPVEIDAWSAAKNANRMIKAAALGIPVLASATPEHIRAAELMGLPESRLVGAGESWTDRIGQIAEEYESVQRETGAIRTRTLAAYDPKAIAGQVFSSVFAAGKRRAPSVRATHPRLADVDLFLISLLDPNVTFHEFENRSEIDLRCFSQVHVFDERIVANERLTLSGRADVVSEPNVFHMYDELQRRLATCESEYVLLVNDGTFFTRSMLQALQFDQDVLGFPTTAFGEAASDLPRHRLEAHRVLEERLAPEMLLVRTEWLVRSGLRADELLTWLHQGIWIDALLSDETVCRLADFPVGVHLGPTRPTNVSRRFAKYCVETRRVEAKDQPNAVNQWIRLSHDIVHTMLERHPTASTTLAARMVRKHLIEAEKAACA